VRSSARSDADAVCVDRSNRDGRLTLGEWPWSRRTFIQQDANSDGSITRSEYRGAPEER
jgi:hypothetical protein